MAIVQFALRDKTRLGALRIRDDVLCCRPCCGPTRCGRPASPSLETTVRISAQEREMSAALVDSMAADFEPDQFTDDYQVQLRQLIEAKLEKGDSLDTEETFGVAAAEAGSGEVIDLMEALKRSLEKKRGEGQRPTAEPAKPAKATGRLQSPQPGRPPSDGGEGAPKSASRTATKAARQDRRPRPRPRPAAPKTRREGCREAARKEA